MNRTCAGMLLLCAVGAGPSLCFALTQDAVPDVHRQSLTEPSPMDRVPVVVHSAAPPRPFTAAPPPGLAAEASDQLTPPPEQPGDTLIPGLFLDEALFDGGTWIDPRVLQAMEGNDRIVKVRKWWVRRWWVRSQGKVKQSAANTPAKR